MSKSKLIKGIILGVCSIGALFAYLILKKVFSGELDKYTLYRTLCDGFFIVGAINLCFAALKFVTYEGAFDSLAYGVKSFFHLRKPTKNFEQAENYGDYVTKKKENRTLDCLFELAIGVPFLIVCLVFFILCKTV